MKNFASKLAPVIKDYLEFRKTLGYSNSSQEKFMSHFDTYYQEFHPDLATLTKESIRGWVTYETSCGRNGMHSKISYLRMLAQYMGNGAYIFPTKSIAKKPAFVPYILTDDELSRLFTAADNIKGDSDQSLKLVFPYLLRLLYTCGLRPHEVRQIKRDNINFTTGEIRIEKTKGHKERIVVMSDDMLEQCRKYDTIRNISNPHSEYFFIRTDGIHVSGRQLTNTFNRCWKKANSDIPANKLPRVRPYDLRHRFASTVLQKWINQGRDLYAMLPYLRAYMGHEHFSATAYYIHLLPENLLNSPGVDWSVIDSVNPEANIWKS